MTGVQTCALPILVLAIDLARKDEALKLLADNNEPAYVLGQIAADTTGTQIVLK